MDAILDELERELAWFTRILDLRFRLYFAEPGEPIEPASIAELPPPEYTDSSSPWAAFLREHRPDPAERLALVLGLVPHLRPQLLDVFFSKNATFDRRFTEFGGVRIDDEFEPTGETLAFVLGGGSLAARFAAARVLDHDHPFVRGDVVRPVALQRDQSAMKSPLRISSEYLGWFTSGARPRPAMGTDFPAQRITTALEWSDLVLHPGTLRQIQEVQTFITHGQTLLHDWGMAARLRPGYRALFHGPPGTGKTMSAALLGKLTSRDVYRVDLSLVVSKYIGETEKNLARVFDRAQQRDWILFFDEAEALFGKRSETKDAHDRYANQEVAYLLQRIEGFDGIVILASNLRDNLDDAFTRRFESIVYFPVPRQAERLELWRRGFSRRAKLDASVELETIARDHELSGGAIINVIRQVSLTSIAEGERPITRDDLTLAIRRELAKEGRGS
ncbi:ATP-binding protein [Nannocystaceae bacterium ST9]